MKKILLITLNVLLISTSLYAMGSKNTDVKTSGDTPSDSKTELAKKVANAMIKARIPQPFLRPILEPLKKELESSWNVKDPFTETIAKTENLAQKAIDIATPLYVDFYTKSYAEKFTEAELKELLKFYESPVAQKDTMANFAFLIEEVLRACKEPKLWQEYTQKYAGLAAGAFVQFMMMSQSVKEIGESFIKEAEKASKELNMDVNSKDGPQQMKKKFLEKYPSLTMFEKTIDSIANTIDPHND